LPFTRITEKEIDSAARQKVPTKVVFQTQRHAHARRQRHVAVAANDPFNLTMLEAVRLVTKCRVQVALSTEADIAKALKRYYGVGAETLDELLQKTCSTSTRSPKLRKTIWKAATRKPASSSS